jgi:hypothetical protein
MARERRQRVRREEEPGIRRTEERAPEKALTTRLGSS